MPDGPKQRRTLNPPTTLRYRETCESFRRLHRLEPSPMARSAQFLTL